MTIVAPVAGSDDLRAALAHPNTRQFLKFALVGFASLAVEYLFLGYFLQALSMDYLLATTIAFIISIVVNYILSMKYVFSHKEDMSRTREFTIFLILSVIGLLLNDGIVLILNKGVALEANIAKIAATALVMIYNFVTRKIFLDGTGA